MCFGGKETKSATRYETLGVLVLLAPRRTVLRRLPNNKLGNESRAKSSEVGAPRGGNKSKLLHLRKLKMACGDSKHCEAAAHNEG